MAANPYASPRSPGTPLVRRRVNRCRRWFAVAVIVFLITPVALAGGPFAYASWRPAVLLGEQWLPIVKFCAQAAAVMLIAGAPIVVATGAAWLKEERRNRLDGKANEQA
jgi:hypothetical protein